MSFDSPAFVCFLPLMAVLYACIPVKCRHLLLLAGSLYFYGTGQFYLLPLLLFVILLSYLAGRLMAWKRERRRIIAGSAVTLLLILLVYCKTLSPVLPVGISFYTFQAIGYMIDVCRGDQKAEKDAGMFALFISFFPQLVAGPIERAKNLLPQLKRSNRPTPEDLHDGCLLLLSGFFRKLVLADTCALFVDRVYSAGSPEGSAVFLGTLLFALQIYCDFSGYSEIAAGAARFFGIHLMRNFDRPYLAPDLKSFWRRWHISLNNWFLDYVYIPLGGSRKGKGRQILAVMAVFLLSGLWHGVGPTYLAWGLMHGAGMAALILMPGVFDRIPKALKILLTQSWVLLAWVFFRSADLFQAGRMFAALIRPWHFKAGISSMDMGITDILLLLLTVSQLPLLHRLSREAYEGEKEERTMPRYGVILYLILCCVLAWILRAGSGGDNAFIYFQF